MDELDMVVFGEGTVTPKSNQLLLNAVSTTLSQQKNRPMFTPALIEHQKTEQLAPYDRYGSVIAKNMMKL